MPPGASADALRVLTARGVRAFGDGFVALLLPIYLVELGFSALAVGAIVTSTLRDGHPHARGGVDRQPISPAVASPCSGGADGGDRRRLCNDH
jgi:hypothetical protein